MLNQNIIINFLTEHKLDYSQKFSIDKLGLFGSFAINTHTRKSDVDIVYETSSRGLSFTQLLELENELENAFSKKIDLINLKYMNPLIKRKAAKDIIYA